VLACLAVACSALAEGLPRKDIRGSSDAESSRPPHWAFVAPVRPSVPAAKNKRWVRNPVDAFILAGLERKGIAPSPEADRITLVRRLFLDLTGLPPTPHQAREFAGDPSPDAYEQLVDELLASPHFGERWGRHWLDLARYADSSGYQVDRPRPSAWLFRDWVIDSFNADQPFDQFTIEQLAGDLMPGATLAQKSAAGFHRLTLSNHEEGVDGEEFRCKSKADRVNTTATVWLGLTVACAECHNHKYDPISQREYYQLYAFFNNADEVDLPAPQPEDQARLENRCKEWEAEQARLKSAIAEAGKTNQVNASQLRKQLARHRRERPSGVTTAHTFQESTNAAVANVHVRGDFLRRGEQVHGATPAVLHRFSPRAASPDRLDLARWIVDPSNPLTARVAANNVWQHLFGRGLVSTPNDFGTRGDRPSHPELLDWLACEFMAPTAPVESLNCLIVRSGKDSVLNGTTIQRFNDSTIQPFNASTNHAWSRKALIRLIVTSATYRQSSHVRREIAERDPLNLLLARQNRLRVESEILRDLYLAISGLLNDEIGGPSFRPVMPEETRKLGIAGAFSWDNSTGPELYRRGLYVFAQRTVPYPTSMTFDQANSSESCPQRERSTTPLQALTLLNHGLFVECGRALAARIAALPGQSAREKIEAGFELCLERAPSREELDRLERLYQETAAAPAAKPEEARSAAFLHIAQVLLNLDEFMTRE